MPADRLVGESDRSLVVRCKCLRGSEAEVRPEPVRINLVADDPIPNPAITTVGPVPAFRQELDGGLVPSPPFWGDGVKSGQVIRTLGVVSRVQQDPSQIRIGALVVEQDQRDHDAPLRKRPDLLVHGFQVSPLEVVGSPLASDRRIVGVTPWIDELT